MHPLIMVHAVLGEMGALAFLWVLVELLSPTESRIRRAQFAALLGVSFLVLAWIIAGYYYLNDYQSAVKPLIKAGPYPWAHGVFTETKEHVFMFIPFLAVVAWGTISHYGSALMQEKNARIATILISALIVMMAFAMAGMGFIISSGARGALEAESAKQAQQTETLL